MKNVIILLKKTAHIAILIAIFMIYSTLTIAQTCNLTWINTSYNNRYNISFTFRTVAQDLTNNIVKFNVTNLEGHKPSLKIYDEQCNEISWQWFFRTADNTGYVNNTIMFVSNFTNNTLKQLYFYLPENFIKEENESLGILYYWDWETGLQGWVNFTGDVLPVSSVHSNALEGEYVLNLTVGAFPNLIRTIYSASLSDSDICLWHLPNKTGGSSFGGSAQSDYMEFSNGIKHVRAQPGFSEICPDCYSMKYKTGIIIDTGYDFDAGQWNYVCFRDIDFSAGSWDWYKNNVQVGNNLAMQEGYEPIGFTFATQYWGVGSHLLYDRMFSADPNKKLNFYDGPDQINNFGLENYDELFEEEETDPLLLKFAPIFYLHPDEYYEPREIASLMDYSDLKKDNALIKSAPTLIEDITDLEESKKYSMDMNNVEIHNLYDLPDPNDFKNHKIEVYGRKTIDENSYTHLQYFIFYPFQNWFFMDHEGDWELVQVTLNDINKIHSITYFFNDFAETYFDLDLLEFLNKTHPVVLVAKGSHNTYGNNEPYFLPFKPPEEIEFWTRLFWGFKSLDKISKDGTVIKPSDLPTEVDEYNYEIQQIDSSMPFINYEGRWGQKSIIPFRSGPRGPKHSERFKYRWLIPNTMADLPEFPFMGVILYSPLDIEVLDENGVIDEFSEDTIFYTGVSNEPEAILIKGYKNYTVNLIANDTGKFTLEVYYYDNETGIMVKYKNISNTEDTKATLNVSKNSNFTLYVDQDGDGEYDEEHLPDEVITYNGFVYVLDLDQDRVIDIYDNCPNQFNPLQLDFNSNNKGDACDNPRYYKNKSLELLAIEPENKLEKLAEKHIRKSLDLRYWEDNFTINSKRVFISELVAIRLVREHKNISQWLAEADSLIVERTLLNLDKETLNKKEKRSYKIATLFYKRGNKLFNEGKYRRAILNYMTAWTLLNNKA